jgi:acetoacetate decarboxylase
LPAAASCGAFRRNWPKIVHEGEVIVGTLHYGSVLCATGTMGYKHREADHDSVLASLAAPNFLIKIIPHVDGTPRICELVRYYLTDIMLKEAWTAPAALDLRPHVMADVAKLPVLDIVSAVHFKADLTLGLGEVVLDYLSDHSRLATSTTQPERIRA